MTVRISSYLILFSTLAGCLSCLAGDAEAESSCQSGATQSCTCSGGRQGGQRCVADGSSWGPCQCGPGSPDLREDNVVEDTPAPDAGDPTVRELQVTVVGLGSVTSSPAGIDCGETCRAEYATGATVTLTAQAGEGRELAGWSGTCAGTGTCSVTLDVDRSVGAVFRNASTASDRCAGLVTDRQPHPMSTIDPPERLEAIVDPEFGTTIRRITAVSASEGENAIIKPMYSTMPAWSADEAFLILWHRERGHELYNGRTYEFIRVLDELYEESNPTDIEQVYWDPTEPNVLYFPSNYVAQPDFYRVTLGTDGSRGSKERLHRFSDLCPTGDWGQLLTAGSDPFYMSWSAAGTRIGLACGPLAIIYDIDNDEVLGSATGLPDVPQVTPSGRYAYVGGALYDSGLELIESLALSPYEHASLGLSLETGHDTYNWVQFDGVAGNPQVGTLLSMDLDTREVQGIIPDGDGWPYPPSDTHISAVATRAPGWVAVSCVGYEGNGQDLLDNELLLANTDTGMACRIGHHRSRADHGPWGYWSEPHANISPTGTRVLFGSDWGGGDTVDTYVVELPSYRP